VLTAGDLIGMDDPAGEPYKEAVRVLLRAIIANDEATARAAFVGTGDDLKLLELTLETNRAMARLRRAVETKLGGLGEYAGYFRFSESALGSVDVQTVSVGGVDGPSGASISPGGFPSDGYCLERRDGRWLVRSMTVFPEDMQAILAVLRDLAAQYDAVARRVNRGEFSDVRQVLRAMPSRFGADKRAHPSLEKMPNPTTRPARRPRPTA
jgi:hypothetical protein